MRAVVGLLLKVALLYGVSADAHVVEHRVDRVVIVRVFAPRVVPERVDRARAVALQILPAVVVDHRVAETVIVHIVENVPRDRRPLVLVERSDEIHVFFVNNPAEEIGLLLGRIGVLCKMIERRRYDQPVEFLCMLAAGVTDSHPDRPVIRTLDPDDLCAESGRMDELFICLLIDALCPFLPCPEPEVDEFDCGRRVEVFHDIGGRDLVEEAVAERRVRGDPDLHDVLDAVLFAEFRERKREVLQMRISSLDLKERVIQSLGEAVIAAFCDAAVPVAVIASVLGLHEVNELLHLFLQLEQVLRFLDRGLAQRIERINFLSMCVAVHAPHIRAVKMAGLREFFNLVHGVIGDGAHDCAGLKGALLAVYHHLRRPAFAANTVLPLVNRVIAVALELKIHGSGNSGGTSADDADLFIQIFHTFSSCMVFVLYADKRSGFL